MTPNLGRAEEIVVEILRHAKSGLNRTQVYKAFWLAHLYYANDNPGYLSDWPIVKMPNGPGIDKGDVILGQLAAAGRLEQVTTWAGPFVEKRCRLAPLEGASGLLPAAVDAIKKAVAFVEPKTGDELSRFSHDHSRSWQDRPLGGELDIYRDLIPDEEYNPSQEDAAVARREYEGIFG